MEEAVAAVVAVAAEEEEAAVVEGVEDTANAEADAKAKIPKAQQHLISGIKFVVAFRKTASENIK